MSEPRTVSEGEVFSLKPGEMVYIGGKLYGACFFCHRVQRLDGLSKGKHICARR